MEASGEGLKIFDPDLRAFDLGHDSGLSGSKLSMAWVSRLYFDLLRPVATAQILEASGEGLKIFDSDLRIFDLDHDSDLPRLALDLAGSKLSFPQHGLSFQDLILTFLGLSRLLRI